MTFQKLILTLILTASVLAAAAPAHACPRGYDSCGEYGQLCCPR